CPPARWTRLRAYRLLWWLGFAVLVLDQATKTWIAQKLPFNTYGWPGQIVVIEGFFNLVHVGNTGAAWSLFAGKSFFLAILAAATLGGIYLWRHQLGLRSRVAQVGFGLLCGGIVGNLVDRLLHGHVIDFLDFHFGGYVYPTFNVADMGICIGVGIYLIHSLLQPGPGKNENGGRVS
ncbi:signal peptidase II, partial [Geminisphaera colitermitum]|uniref:signal peptidase II n=1 Tax=Geminisphaera colitermitum TaxID=1148786 RepID=UPI000694F37A